MREDLWWILLLNILGYLVARYGMISRGNSKVIIEFFGWTLLLFSFIFALFVLGASLFLVLIPIFLFIITPIVEFLIFLLKKRIEASYRKNINRENLEKLKKLTVEALKEEKELQQLERNQNI